MEKAVIGILYIVFSVIWLFFSIIFSSALWLEGPGTKEWKEDAMFIPIGIIMLLLWIISLIPLVNALKNKKKTYSKDNIISPESK